MNDFGMVATGVTIDDENVMEMASLCQIQKWVDVDCIIQNDSGSDRNKLLTLQCVGRVKLQNILQQYPHVRSEFTLVVEEIDNVDLCSPK